MNWNEMTTQDVVCFYDISIRKLYYLRKMGLPFKKGNSTLCLYNYDELERYLNVDREIYSKDRLLVTMEHITKLSGYSKGHLYNLIYKEDMPCYKLRGVGSRIMYRFVVEEVLEWLKLRAVCLEA